MKKLLLLFSSIVLLQLNSPIDATKHDSLPPTIQQQHKLFDKTNETINAIVKKMQKLHASTDAYQMLLDNAHKIGSVSQECREAVVKMFMETLESIEDGDNFITSPGIPERFIEPGL